MYKYRPMSETNGAKGRRLMMKHFPGRHMSEARSGRLGTFNEEVCGEMIE